MELEGLFRETVEALRAAKAEFAVCGGIAAMLYRHEIRFTGDIDFLLGPSSQVIELATQIIEGFGLRPTPLREAQLGMAPRAHKKQTRVAVIIGRDPSDKNAPGVDFLLPVQSWTSNALTRAKENIISLHGITAPFLTAEDILLAKFSALSGSGSRREKDWSDVLSIFESGRTLDIAYLCGAIDSLRIHLPPTFEKELPKALAVVFKRIRTSS